MKTKALISFIITGVIFLAGCGKPNDPDSIFDSGGYRIVSTYQTSGFAKDVVVCDTLCYIAQGEGGLTIVNVKDPENPKHVTTLTKDVRGYSRNIVKYSNYVLLAAGSYGFTSVNVADANLPVVASSNINMKPAKSATIMNKYLFAAISEQGVNIAEMANTGIPDIRSKVSTKGYAQAVAISSDSSKMFVACGEMGLQVFDISAFDNGYGSYPELGWINTTGYASSITLNEDAKIALLGCESTGLQLIDYSDPHNLKLIATFQTDNDLVSVKFYHNLAYLCLEKGGFQILDISDPTNIESKAHLNLSYAVGCDMNENYIYVANNDGGLVIIKRP